MHKMHWLAFLNTLACIQGQTTSFRNLTKGTERKKRAKDVRARFQQKKRVIGTPSTRPREEGPKWALKEVATDCPAAEDKEDGDSTSSEEDSSDCFSDIELPS